MADETRPDAVNPAAAPGKHLYHAEATALQGDLLMPLKSPIDSKTKISLDPKGGYQAPPAVGFRLGSVLSYKSGYTQVSGIEGTKACKGHATLSTAVVEGLNILEILTCDRVVAQIATHHPVKGHTPEIVFLGTRFENLRIAGHQVHVTLDIDTIGPKPLKDLHYLDEPCFLCRVSERCKDLHSYRNLPPHAAKRYTGESETVGPQRFLEFSLATKITGAFPGKSFGHILHVPHFGTIDLATVKITCDDDGKTPPRTTVELKMLEVELGCIGHGSVNVASAKTNAGKGP